MKNQYWNEVLTAGFILGILYTSMSFLSYAFNNNQVVNVISSIGGFVVIAWSLVFYGKRAAAIKDVDGVGFTYGQAFGFSMLVLLLSGVIVGVGQWTLQNIVDPAYFEKIMTDAMKEVASKLNSEQLEAVRKSQDMMRSIWAMVGSSMLSMGLLGGLVALGTSAVVKRKPQIF